MQTQSLNDFLTEKGVSTHLKVKRSLAQAFGLPMDNGTEEQQAALLKALLWGSAALVGEPVQSYRVDVAFDGHPSLCFDTIEAAKAHEDIMNEEGHATRIVRTITISQVM